jgi:hypothetical protein
MKRNQFRESASDQPARQVEDEAANSRRNDTDMQDYESSADVYERRWRQRVKHDGRDWWIAVAAYLLLAGVAFVVV